MTISITVNSTPYSIDATPTQVRGLSNAWADVMAQLADPGGYEVDGAPAPTPVASRPGYVADPTTWLQNTIAAWAAANPSGITQSGPVDPSTGLPTTITIGPQQMMAQCLASWDAAGPSPAPAPPTPVPLTGATLLQVLAAQSATAIKDLIDSTARAREYLDGTTCASYATSTVPAWRADALAFIAWRDSVWVAAYAIQTQVEAGTLAPPSVAALIAQLPSISWPT